MDKKHLKGLLAAYPHNTKVEKDILNLLQQFHALHPQPENPSDHRSAILLTGTLPVNYKQNVYNIPVSIRIPLGYPNQVPQPFVVPTQQMVIKVNQNVDQMGQFYHPYLNQWQPQKSDLIGLLQAMQNCFSKESPVYSRPATSMNNSRPSQSLYRPNVQQTQQPNSGYSNNYYQNSNYYQSTNPYQQPQSSSSIYSPMPSTSTPPPPMYQPPQQHQPSYAMPMPQPIQLPPSLPTTLPTPQLSSLRSQSSQLLKQASQQDIEEVEKMSLRSALYDQMKRTLNEMYQQMSIEMDQALTSNQNLTQRKIQVEQGLEQLKQNSLQLEQEIQQMKQKQKELQELLTRESSKSQPLPEEIYMPTAPIYRQLLDLTCDDFAIEDCFYYLGKALNTEKITLNVYMKYIRMLANEQFYKRALIIKIKKLVNNNYQ